MKLAAFNVENMFERAKALNGDSWDEGREVLEDYARLNELIQEPAYTPKVAAEMLALMKKYKGLLTQCGFHAMPGHDSTHVGLAFHGCRAAIPRHVGLTFHGMPG